MGSEGAALRVFTEAMLQNLILGQARDELLDGLVLFESDDERAAMWRRERNRIMQMRGHLENCPTPWGFRGDGFAHGDRPEAWWRYDAPGAPIDPAIMTEVERALFLRKHNLLQEGEEAEILGGSFGRQYASRLKTGREART